jgi:chromosomal replication initiator protein
VAEQPAQAYNPLFIYGPPGLGKTHLLHAIGNYVRLHGQGLTVRYATIEAFTNEFVAAVRGTGAEAFKRRFREPDVLLIDDVQFLADKTRTKEEFFHSFNALYESGRQLVITSDQSPGDLDRVEARLQERFGSGLVAELTSPDLEARTAILRKRCGLDSVHEVDDDTVLEIARSVPASVRVLEGALIRVVAYASLKGRPATPELAREVLSRLYPGPAEVHSCTQAGIQAATAEAFGVSPAALLAQDRRPRTALARQVAMYLVRELTDESLPSIGAGFGGRNHSTVLHALRRVPQRMDTDTEVRAAVDKLRAGLGGGRTDRTW